MVIFSLLGMISFVLLLAAFALYPRLWDRLVLFIPLVAFILYVQWQGDYIDSSAFILSGFVSVFVIMLLHHHQVRYDRLLLGMNVFFVVGAIGYLFSIPMIIDWYAGPIGIPFFSSLILTGLWSIFFTEVGFVGIKYKNPDVAQRMSFLLLAIVILALLWNMNMVLWGFRWAVIVPALTVYMIYLLIISSRVSKK